MVSTAATADARCPSSVDVASEDFAVDAAVTASVVVDVVAAVVRILFLSLPRPPLLTLSPSSPSSFRPLFAVLMSTHEKCTPLGFWGTCEFKTLVRLRTIPR